MEKKIYIFSKRASFNLRIFAYSDKKDGNRRKEMNH